MDPLKIVQRDKRLIKSVIATWNDKKDVASIQISKMEELLKLIDKAFEYIKSLAEEKLKELLEFAKKKISITYLVVNDDEKIVAYFTLAHKPTLIPCDALSKTTQKKNGTLCIVQCRREKI